jgi:uncharacterized repeat protein (TIGR01451 family)
VNVSDFLPQGLIATAATGTGWACGAGSFVNCSRSDSLAVGATYPPITITVNVSGGVPSVTNFVNMNGGGDPNFHSAFDLTHIKGPALAIAKFHVGDFSVGQTGSYTITVDNKTGNMPTTGTVTVQDSLPNGLSATSVTGPGWSCSGTTFVTCTRSDSLAAGGTYPSISMTVNVTGGAPSVNNVASVTGGGDPNNHSANDFTFITGPTLAITKSHTGDPFVVGQTGAYTITVDNKAGKAASVGTVTVRDFLPNGLTATSVTATGWNCSNLPTTFLSCSRSDALAAGDTYPAIAVTVSVTGGGPSVTNFASVSGGGDGGFHSASDLTNISSPILAITKTHASDPFIVGQTGAYTITVSNTGKIATSGAVNVQDFLPSGLTLSSASGTGWGCSGTFSLNCTRSDSLAPNSSYPPLSVVVNVGNSMSTVTNTASVTGGGDSSFHNASDTANVTAPTLAISKSHTGDFTVGQQGSYIITVSNVGNVATIGTVSVSDFLPFQLALSSASGTGWGCNGTSCTRSDSLAPNSSYPPLTFTVIPNGGASSVTNSASVTGGGDGNTHSASDPTKINTPSLAIAKSHSGSFTVGQNGSYTITVSNPGSIGTAGTVSVNDNLPPGLTAVGISAPGWGCSFPPTTFVNCSRSDPLAAGASYPPISLTVSVSPTAPGLVVNQASVNGGGDSAQHSVSDPTTITLPDLAITMSHAGNFALGQLGTYTIRVSNVGTIPIGGGSLLVDDLMPAGLTATAASGTGWTCSILPGPQTEMNCMRTADALAPGSSYPPITLTVNVDPQAPASITNTVGVFGISESNFANNVASDTAAVVLSGALSFVPVTPCRVVDTRNPDGPFGGPFLSGLASRAFAIPSSACSIPATAQAYSLNVTVVPHTGLGFLTMYPCGQSVPGSSTLNSYDARVKAVGAIVPAGTNGGVCAFTTNDTELVLDINGYFVSSRDTSALAFYPMTPCRLADTRNPVGALGGPGLVGQGTRSFPLLSSPCNVPSAAQAYSLNVTAVPKTSIAFLTTWPAGQALPLASTLNAPSTAAVANAAIVPAGTNGDVSVFSTHDTDLVIDVNGYFAPPNTGGLSLFNVAPCRVLDTRLGGSPAFTGQKDVNVVASSCGTPASAQAYVLNATVVPPVSLGFLTLWPQGTTQPLASTLNSFDGAVNSNMALTPTTNGLVSAFASTATHLIVDISGYFGSPTVVAPTLAVAENNATQIQRILETPADLPSSRSETVSTQSASIPEESAAGTVVSGTPTHSSAELHSTAVGREVFLVLHGNGVISGAKAVAESVRHSESK